MTESAYADPALDETDLDGLDAEGTDDNDLLDASDVVDETPADGADATGTAKTGTPARGLTRATIRRIAAKAEEITTTPDRIVEVTASMLGTSVGLADLTTAIMAAPRSASGPIHDLATIAEADPFEAAVHATALGKDRLKAVWNLLAALGADGVKGAMPGALPKAAITVAKAVFGLDNGAKAEIEAVSALLKKN